MADGHNDDDELRELEREFARLQIALTVSAESFVTTNRSDESEILAEALNRLAMQIGEIELTIRRRRQALRSMCPFIAAAA